MSDSRPVNMSASGPPETVLDPEPGDARAALAEALGRPQGSQRDAVDFLAEQHIEAINIAGGTLAWVRAGHDVVTGTDPS